MLGSACNRSHNDEWLRRKTTDERGPDAWHHFASPSHRSLRPVSRPFGLSARPFGLSARPFDLPGGVILRFGLVPFLVLLGLARFTLAEAETIQPRMAHCPFLGWLSRFASVRGASKLFAGAELWTGGALRAFEAGSA